MSVVMMQTLNERIVSLLDTDATAREWCHRYCYFYGFGLWACGKTGLGPFIIR